MQSEGAAARTPRKLPPSRSVSPTNQSAGILFRMAQGAVIESIPVGGFDSLGRTADKSNTTSTTASNHSGSESPKRGARNEVLLAGQPLPPLSCDYGFGYVQRDPKSNATINAVLSNTNPSQERPSRNRESRDRLHQHQVQAEFHLSSTPDSPDGDEDYFDSHQRNPPSGGERKKKVASGSGSHPRVCISCGATKTPYWREAWSSSVLLCNACGLRYSKFRRRCLDCSYVPRKEDKGSKACTKCAGPWS